MKNSTPHHISTAELADEFITASDARNRRPTRPNAIRAAKAAKALAKAPGYDARRLLRYAKAVLAGPAGATA